MRRRAAVQLSADGVAVQSGPEGHPPVVCDRFHGGVRVQIRTPLAAVQSVLRSAGQTDGVRVHSGSGPPLRPAVNQKSRSGVEYVVIRSMKRLFVLEGNYDSYVYLFGIE